MLQLDSRVTQLQHRQIVRVEKVMIERKIGLGTYLNMTHQFQRMHRQLTRLLVNHQTSVAPNELMMDDGVRELINLEEAIE